MENIIGSFVALDEENRIVALNKELFLVQQESKSFSYFKREYGVRIYKILGKEIKQEILNSL